MDSSTERSSTADQHGTGTPSKKRKVLTNKDLEACHNIEDQAAFTTQVTEESSKSLLNKKCEVEEAATNLSSTPDQKEYSSTPENLSRSSTPISKASESDWQPPTHGAIDWIYSQIMNDKNPREIISHLMPDIPSIPVHLSDWDVWRVLIRMLSEPPRRTKLPDINTLSDVIRLIKNSSKIMVLTGAGVSVSCGIPDFRSRDGVYARLAVDFPDLPNPEAMFSIAYFQHDPRPFFKFAKEIYPGQFKPSLVHRFISCLEKKNKLLRNYTQNIDTLEQVAGISRVVQCHGSFSHATCQVCKHQVTGEEIRKDVFDQVVPMCPRCPPGGVAGILKPDIVFFGENLPEHFHRQMTADKEEADLLIVIGSALKVRPVALIPNSLPENVPQILINREPLPHMGFDVELLGDADGVVAHICRELGDDYQELHEKRENLTEITFLPEDLSQCSDAAANRKNSIDVVAEHNVSSSTGDSTGLGSNNDAADKPVSSSVVDSSEPNDAAAERPQAELRGMWKSRWKRSVSRKLPAGSFYYDGNHRYIFPGAEIPPEEESDDSSDDGSSEDGADADPVTSGPPMVRPRFRSDPATSSAASMREETSLIENPSSSCDNPLPDSW